MAMYELITKIAYALLTLTLLSMNFAGIPASYMNLETKVNQSYVEDYRKLAVLENVMALDANRELLRVRSDSGSYRYEKQRAVIPVEFFTQNNEGDTELGYQVTDDGHCYMEQVPALDGEEHGFFIQRVESYRTGDPGFSEPRELGCTEVMDISDSVYAPALLVRKGNGNPRIPVQIYIYSIGDEGQDET
jgi:hypothetical protein